MEFADGKVILVRDQSKLTSFLGSLSRESICFICGFPKYRSKLTVFIRTWTRYIIKCDFLIELVDVICVIIVFALQHHTGLLRF